MPGIAGGGNERDPSLTPPSCRAGWPESANCSCLDLRTSQGFERDEEEGGVGALRLRQKTEALDRDDASNAWRVQQRLVDLLRGGIGALQACRIRQLHGDEQ